MLRSCQFSGSQSFFSEFTQISPFSDILGWYILVKKKPFGGDCGKSSGNISFIRKVPLWNGVYTGP